ncbi:flavin reductase family protein [Hyphomicrobium sp. CS1BSMeth3]|uniref:flavin reductase family protein n=1 Tax=Hyphomicrobium sp. CS1BSMeth3 TaxID=1892844 RepID=UPI000931CABC|nr:flavin reductase family protein [Hyphomicrobium sp. CS1BSMeth3]
MEFDFERMSPTDCFTFLTSTVVPRPIALITTTSPTGACNAAPYTFFSIAGIDPPVVTVTVLPTPDGQMKDTGRNILATGEFVVNLVSEDLAEAMNITCIDAPQDVDELVLAGLEAGPSIKVRPPRIVASPVSLECRIHSSVPLSPNQVLIVGRIVQAHVADRFVISPREPLLDTPAFRLIGGMHGARWYTRTNDLFEMERPTWANWKVQR